VDAGQSEKQLSTYRSMVSRAFPNYKMLFIFLTKRGDEPDDPDGSWSALTFEDMVAAFERFADLPGAEPAAREMLKSYFVMLRRHHMSDPDLEHYARELWRKHRPALEFLMDRQPDGLGQVLRALCDGAAAIAHELQQQGLNVEPETTEGAILPFAIKDWDELPNFYSADSWTKSNRILLLEVTRRRDTMRVFYIIGPGDPETREWIFKALRGDTTLKSNTKLATRWHRIGRENLYKSSDPDEIEVQEVIQECRKKLIGYIKRTVPRMSDLLKAAAPATRGE